MSKVDDDDDEIMKADANRLSSLNLLEKKQMDKLRYFGGIGKRTYFDNSDSELYVCPKINYKTITKKLI